MVDLLSRRGDLAAALRLQELWNDCKGRTEPGRYKSN